MAKILTPYQRAFSDWLGFYKFETFGTFTTKQPLTLPGARRMAGNFGRHINAGESSTMFWAAEPFDTREGYHFHALLKTEIPNKEMWDYWTNQKQFGRSSFVKIHRKFGVKDQIENYCSKYVTKHLADFDLYAGGFNSRSTGLPEKPDYITNYQL